MVQGLPHDVYTILPFKRPIWFDITIGLIILVILLALIYTLYRWYRKRPRVETSTPVKTPWELLLEELQGWESKASFQTASDGREFFFGLSLLLRRGIELGLDIPATDLTLREIRHRLRLSPRAQGIESTTLLEFLDRADMIKFADAPTTPQEARESLQRVRQYLTDLKPEPHRPFPSETASFGKTKGTI